MTSDVESSDSGIGNIEFSLIDRYLANECTDEERHSVEERLARSPDSVASVMALCMAGSAMADTAPVDSSKMAPVQLMSPSPSGARRSLSGLKEYGTPRRWVPAGIAMFLTVLLVAGTYVSMHSPSSEGTPESLEHAVYTTRPGERANITLSDGTRVALNVDSHLEIPANYGGSARDVSLTGEAVFTVVHDRTRPFTVKANGVLVRDLATTFSVRAYERAGATTVAVRDGRIAVQLPNLVASEAITVDPAQYLRVVSEGTYVLGDVKDEAAFFGWMSGTLVLRKAPLASALAELSRWYGMEFRVSDRRLLDHDLTITLPSTLTQVALDDIADVLGVRVERGGDVITLLPLR